MEELKIGSTGKAVKELQLLLNAVYKRFNAQIEIDGIFGAETDNILKDFQADNSLVVDGIAGQKTQTKLSEVYNELFPKQETKSLRERLECTLKSGGHSMARPPKSKHFSIRNGLNDVFHQIVSWIDVENDPYYHKRQNDSGTWSTYCNVYAYQFLCYTWAYIPRVWWDNKTHKRIIKGESIEPVYGENCSEMNANALYYWLLRSGSYDFGWKRVATAQEFQDLVNNGAVGVICAARKDRSRSGHITVGIPENEDYKMVNGVPLQSQAGWDCMNYHNIGWYKAPKFEAFGFFVCRQPKNN